MPSQFDPDHPTNPPENPSTPVAVSKATSKAATTQQKFAKLHQRVESRRSARSRNLQDPILAPGFGTQRDLQRLARELTQASSSSNNSTVFTVEAIQCLMERRGRGLRQTEEEAKAPVAATSSAWDDFMEEAGMGAATKEEEEEPVLTGKRGRSSAVAEATTTASTSTTSSREYNLAALESAASLNKKFKPNASSNSSGGILLQTGTLDCAIVGRKMAELNWAAPYTLSVPTRILSSSIKIQKVIAAGHACHCIAITTRGIAYGWGRNEQMQLGSSFPKNVYQPTPLVSEDHMSDLVTDAAVGKGHSLLLLRSGQMMACGSNKSGQCGINSTAIEVVPNFRNCTFASGGDTPTVIQVACGEDFSLALCSEGKIYSTGSSEFGQLGNGSTGEYFLTANKLAFANCATFTRRTTFCHAPNEKIYSTSDTNTKVVPLSEDIRIQQIACGKHHAMALEADVLSSDTNVQPRLFTWGCGNYGVLGHGVQADEYYPRNVGALGNLHFTASGSRRAVIAAGQHCSLLLTGQGHVYYWGKHRMVGEATMRPSLVDALAHNDHIVTHCAAGGQTVVCCTVHGQCVGWGQGPHGELGLGLDRKSSSKPTFVPGLEGCHVLSLGCGYGTTVFVVRDTEDADRAAIAKIPVLNPSATDGLAAANAEDAAASSKPTVSKKSKAK
jgi:alpha-tubulin suppressor-like RCC1 family protein